ncbi:hypothetical protein [Burkholderia pseudomallei]|nr:hypothetical protein [Burkholderia pseudomallei]MBF3417655.1 hypothetical protein [Burkholderia pseudomallei]MBF3522144.1 hypothetical protein [Burkholderia pseudomallei]MBF3572694.1 hypothetical protein [Burkholderia pseudomallei]MBF4018796.1 hypothetical protein [Burkholderia pseudomallei]MBF4066983.1 hypothetical protein [Burkholderia pseudomallei]
MSALAACARTGDDEARRKATMRPFAPDASASGAGGRVRDVCAMCAPARVKIKESFE